ncbi:MAG: hypothetical protein LBH07_08060 [Treponema sp.]|jgi:hypothetical protein|nr:hypothetical protein [Treponema sp.]
MNSFFIGLALAVLLWVFSFLYFISFIRRRTSPDHILAMLQEEVQQLAAIIDEKTEQNLQLLEEKIRSLREICTEAERRIAVYNRELEKREQEIKTLSIIKAPVKPEVKGQKIQDYPDLQENNKLHSVDVKTAEKAYRVQTKRPRHKPVSPPSPLSEPADLTEPAVMPTITLSKNPLNIKPPPIRDRIAELYKAGFSPDLIAKRLGLKLGEVKLYVNLAEKL